MSRTLTVRLGQFAAEALLADAAGEEPAEPETRLAEAIRLYLGDRDSGRPAWPYPRFMRGRATGAEVEIAVTVDDEVWSELREEARRQGVTPQQMSAHAVFYAAAEGHVGRVTEDLFDDPEEDEDATPPDAGRPEPRQARRG